MALATLQGIPVPNTNPRHNLKISHSPSLVSSVPFERLYSQYVKTKKVAGHPLLLCTAQKVFHWFRHAGPLVSVRVDVDIGFPGKTCVLEYWDEEHALYARAHCRFLHSSLHGMPPFILRTFSPTSLQCSNLGAAIHENDIRGRLKQFGTTVHIRVVQPRTVHCLAFVIYKTREEASSALDAMKTKSVFGPSKMHVRYFEPGVQTTFRETKPGDGKSGAKPNPPKSEKKPTEPTCPREREAPKKSQAEQGPQRDEAKQARQVEELQRLYAEMQRLREEEARVKERNAIKRTAAESAARAAEEKVSTARGTAQELERAMSRATERRQEARQRVSEADAAVAEAERVLEEAMRRRSETAQELDDAQAVFEYYAGQLKDVTRQTRDSLQETKDRLQQEEREVAQRTLAEDEEVSRRAELAESKWRMKDMSLQDSDSRQHRGDGCQTPNSAKSEDDTRRRAYEAAAAKERARCKQRDQLSWSQRVAWTAKTAVERFKAVSREFDEIKFSDVQPLTFECIPWPDLRDPTKLRLERIDWTSVDSFFQEMRVVVDASEYKELVVKAPRRFHPDKWRARGLLNTVMDDALRQSLEAAGLAVSQSLTPLWKGC
ncbi:hypothetical protein PsYK624_098510 [Phanerochaete sordida]|uniref:RRM domain-containing protein n=1 Tax=Phanerochaete sordida TaxID=48140 RepID=A0A9P3GF94_9APHY|nr:hypothetical protein PsYK624_098510 [Phanerochaete sordida]